MWCFLFPMANPQLGLKGTENTTLLPIETMLWYNYFIGDTGVSKSIASESRYKNSEVQLRKNVKLWTKKT